MLVSTTYRYHTDDSVWAVNIVVLFSQAFARPVQFPFCAFLNEHLSL